MKKIIELKNITKAFDGEPVLQNVNLDIYDNELDVYKRQRLNLLAGL